MPNWVGYLAKRNIDCPVLVWNYAEGGATVDGVESQIQVRFAS